MSLTTKENSKQNGPNLLIIIVNWNTKDLLRQCLESVQNCQDVIRYSTVVVDNASADGSVEMVEADYSKCRLVQNEENIGFARANNKAFKLFPKYPYYLLLNSDATVTPETILAMWSFMEKHADFAAVGPALRLPDGQFQAGGAGWGPRAIHAFNTFLMLANMSRQCRGLYIIQKHYTGSGEPVIVDWLAGACMLVRGKALEHVGLFDERYFVYGEDAEWCWRAGEKGWKIAYLPYISVLHHFGGSSGDGALENTVWFQNLADGIKRRGGRVNYSLFLVFGLIGYALRLSICQIHWLLRYSESLHKNVRRYASLMKECCRLILSSRSPNL